VAAVIVIVCAILLWLRSDRICLLAVLVIGFALCCYLVAIRPISPTIADMLTVITDANRLLLAGRNPYAQTYSNLFYYLPVQSLVYLPPVVMDFDPRVVNLACFSWVAFLVIRLVDVGRLDAVALLVLCPIMLSRSSVEMIIYGQVWPFWALLVGFAATLLSPGRLKMAILLGVLLATQQPVLVIAVLVGVWLLFHRGIAAAFAVTAVATGIFAMILAPWLVLRPTLLHYLYIDIQGMLTPTNAVQPQPGWNQVSILNLLQEFGIRSIRPILQAVIAVAGMLYLAIARDVRINTLICTHYRPVNIRTNSIGYHP
jgi:hypothetical protein